MMSTGTQSEDGASSSYSIPDDQTDGGWQTEGGSSTGSSRDKSDKSRDGIKEVEKLARTETIWMQLWKVLTLALIIAMGAAVSILTYIYLAGEEEDDFTEAFQLFARNAGEATSLHVDSIFEAMEGLSAELTSFSLMTSVSFPFVTMQQFEVNAMHARIHSGIEIIFTVPQVTGDQKANWEAYTKENGTWLEESREIAVTNDPELDSAVFVGKKITSFLYQQNGGALSRSPDGLELYSPVWQSSPPPLHPRLQNYNLHSNDGIVKQYEAMLEARGESDRRNLGVLRLRFPYWC
jgi:hypothetical protein